MQKNQRARFLLVLAAGVAIGCDNGNAAPPSTDAASDVAVSEGGNEASHVEASTEGNVEAGSTDGGIDGALLDTGTDTGIEASADTGTEAATDAGLDSGVPAAVIAEPGYSLTLWAKGTGDYFNPDSIDYDGIHYWVGFQNKTTKDGSDGGPGFGTTSTIVEYGADGTVMAKYTTPGHNDGLRFDPVGHKVWATSNEDGTPHLVSIDPSETDASAAVVEYAIVSAADASAPHVGGYDDLRFLGGAMFVVASAPSGAVHEEVLDAVTISGTTATFAPVAFTDSVAFSSQADAPSTLALSDPDSLAIDDHGRLALVGQDDKQVILISNPGAPSQSLSVLNVATQLEDPVWVTKATGRLLLVDGTANAIYEVHTAFTVGTVFAVTDNAATIPGMLGTLDLTTGSLKPAIIGMGKPTGLIFVQQ